MLFITNQITRSYVVSGKSVMLENIIKRNISLIYVHKKKGQV